MAPNITIAVCAALAASCMSCWLLMRKGPRDAPTEARKAHTSPTPTSGGLGVALGLSLGLLLAFEAGAGIGADYLPLAALALALLLIGFADDVFNIPARLKFLLFATVAVGGAASGGVVTALPLAPGEALALPYALGLIGTALWIFTLVNAVNFMDGANGVAMGSMAIGLGGVAAIALAEGLPAIAVANLCCVGALVGFLVWNFPHGRLFAGDAGALFVGAVGAFGSLVLIARAGVSPFVPPILFFPILADVLLTMLWRARRGRRLLEPHAEHLYQVALRALGSHTPVALAYWGAMTACVGLGVAVSQHGDPRASWIALAGLATAAAAVSKVVRARLDSQRARI